MSNKVSSGSKIIFAIFLAAAGVFSAPLTLHAADWTPKIGETIVYNMKMFRITLANQTMKIEKMDKQNGAECILMSSSSRSTPMAKRIMEIDDRTETCVTPDKLAPVAYTNRTRETGWKSDNKTLFKKGKIVRA
ncbi:MAG TPA: DUF3108 domain-containing protein [bacterium]|nr:DUF3108 domain-containing protein [bacterium]